MSLRSFDTRSSLATPIGCTPNRMNRKTIAVHGHVRARLTWIRAPPLPSLPIAGSEVGWYVAKGIVIVSTFRVRVANQVSLWEPSSGERDFHPVLKFTRVLME